MSLSCQQPSKVRHNEIDFAKLPSQSRGHACPAPAVPLPAPVRARELERGSSNVHRQPWGQGGGRCCGGLGAPPGSGPTPQSWDSELGIFI